MKSRGYRAVGVWLAPAEYAAVEGAAQAVGVPVAQFVKTAAVAVTALFPAAPAAPDAPGSTNAGEGGPGEGI